MDSQIQSNQDLTRIQADIRLATREYNKILKDIEQFETSKTAALKEGDQQIRIQKASIERLTNEGIRLSTLCRLYSQTLADLELAMKDYGKEDVERAEQKVKEIYGEAERTRADADAYMKRVEVKDNSVKLREIEADKKLVEAKEIQEKTAKLQIKLDEQQKAITHEEITAKQSLVEANKLLDDISRQIREKRMQNQGLDIIISNKTKQADAIGVEANAKLTEAHRLLSVADKRKEAQDARDITQNNKEIWLSDREATVGRAYRETLQRGGKLN